MGASKKILAAGANGRKVKKPLRKAGRGKGEKKGQSGDGDAREQRAASNRAPPHGNGGRAYRFSPTKHAHSTKMRAKQKAGAALTRGAAAVGVGTTQPTYHLLKLCWVLNNTGLT